MAQQKPCSAFTEAIIDKGDKVLLLHEEARRDKLIAKRNAMRTMIILRNYCQKSGGLLREPLPSQDCAGEADERASSFSHHVIRRHGVRNAIDGSSGY